MTDIEILDLLNPLADAAHTSKRFKTVAVIDELLRCDARDVEAEAWYQVGPVESGPGGEAVWVGVYTPDRWLSESVEADVLHQGDSFEELLEEELVDQGYEGKLKIEHFRDDAKVFVFRSPVALGKGGASSSESQAGRIVKVLLAYEACFRELGDMPGESDDL